MSRAMLSLPGEQSARVDHRNEKKEFFGDWIQTRAAFSRGGASRCRKSARNYWSGMCERPLFLGRWIENVVPDVEDWKSILPSC